MGHTDSFAPAVDTPDREEIPIVGRAPMRRIARGGETDPKEHRTWRSRSSRPGTRTAR